MPRKQHDIHYIYKTTCVVTGRYYIGMHSTSNLNDGYLGSGKQLRHSIRKYGKENHHKEILEFLESRELLVETEKKIISTDLLSDKQCMNLVKGGEGGNLLNDEQRKIIVSLGGIAFREKLNTDIEFRKSRGEFISKRNVSNHKLGVLQPPPSFLGKEHSDESKELMRQKKVGKGKGETNSQYGTCWITKDGVNKKVKFEEAHTYIENGWLKGRKYYG